MSRHGQESLYDKLCRLIDYHLQEFHMTPIEIIGCLEAAKLDFQNDAAGLARLEDLGEGEDAGT